MITENMQLKLFETLTESADTEAAEKKIVEMKVTLQLKKRAEFFWIRGIQRVDISQCCAKCFLGKNDTRLYHATKGKRAPLTVELDVQDAGDIKAWYLCGLSAGFTYRNNTHVAFVAENGSTVEVDDAQINLIITNARHIPFQDYVPNPEGEYTRHQRTCRNWIFANYLKDGQPL